SVAVNAPTACTATVADVDGGTASTPTGTVSWSSDASGSFSAATCTLDGGGSCSVSYTPAPGSEGTHNVTGSYLGDADHAVSQGVAAVTATQRSTNTAVSCLPATVPVNAATTCTATVSDTDAGTAITPGGTV